MDEMVRGVLRVYGREMSGWEIERMKERYEEAGGGVWRGGEKKAGVLVNRTE